MNAKSVDPESKKGESLSEAELKALNVLEKVKATKTEIDGVKLEVEKVLGEAQAEKAKVATDLAAFIDAKKTELKAVRKGYDSVVASATANKLCAKYEAKAQVEKKLSERHAFCFYLTLLGLVVGAGLILWLGKDGIAGVSEVGLRIVKYLPLYAPVIWFACYKNHLANLSKRLSEAYAHKSLMAATFSGFAEQVREVAETDETLAGELKGRMLDAMIRVFEQDTQHCTKDVKTYLPVTEVADSGVKLFEAVTAFMAESRKDRQKKDD